MAPSGGMKTSPEGRALIEAFEGLFLKTYRDAVGVLTIGYGHTSKAGGPMVGPGMAITEAQADAILGADLAAVEKNVAACITVRLEQYEFDALVSFDFNTGALGRSSIRTKINAGDKPAAMATLLLYDHAGGKVLSGLTRRRNAEKLMFEGKVQPALRLADAHVTLNAGVPTAKASPQPVPVPPPPDVAPVPSGTPQGGKHIAAGAVVTTATIAASRASSMTVAALIFAAGLAIAAAVYFIARKRS